MMADARPAPRLKPAPTKPQAPQGPTVKPGLVLARPLTAPPGAKPPGKGVPSPVRPPAGHDIAIPVPTPGFQRHSLTISARTPHLLYDGKVPPRKRGSFVVADDAGREVKVQLRALPWTTRPGVLVDRKQVLAPVNLPWYFATLVGLPMLLVFAGGLIGGGFGAGGATLNAFVAKTKMSIALRLVVMCAVLVAAVVGWLVVAIVFLGLFGK